MPTSRVPKYPGLTAHSLRRFEYTAPFEINRMMRATSRNGTAARTPSIRIHSCRPSMTQLSDSSCTSGGRSCGPECECCV